MNNDHKIAFVVGGAYKHQQLDCQTQGGAYKPQTLK